MSAGLQARESSVNMQPRGEDEQLSNSWSRVRGRIRAEVGDAAFRSWLKPMQLVGLRRNTLRMAVPSRFMRDWINSNYADRLQMLWSEEHAGIQGLEVIVQPPPRPSAAPSCEAAKAPAPAAVASFSRAPESEPLARREQMMTSEEEEAERCRAISAVLDPRFTFENFVVGKPNEFAYAAARRVAEADVVPFNPLFLYSGVGLGKTHLMHAIAWELRRNRPEKRVIYLSAEKFMYEFVRALRTKDTMAFKEQFRSVDVLMIDDVQFISGRDATQEELFHTFNSLVDDNRQIVISADKSPSDLEGVEERMRSRLGWGLVADIHATTYELRLGILQAKVEQLGAPIPEKVLEFLAHKITSNVRVLEGALNRLAAHVTLVGRPVTLETTQDVLQDLLRASDRRVTIEEIQKKVAEHFNIRLSDMFSARRARSVARPRQVAMYLSKQLTSRSLPEIGRKFGGRDHTTVMHAVRRINELKATDHAFAEDLDLLQRMLEG